MLQKIMDVRFSQSRSSDQQSDDSCCDNGDINLKDGKESLKVPSHSKFQQKLKNNATFLRGRGRGRFVAHGSRNSVNEDCNGKKQDSKESYNQRFMYGNFHHYYGYRNQDSPDLRLLCLKKEWIENRDVLDIGCNAGHFTLAVARDFSPRMIIGMDIDPYLVRTAKKNVKHYLTDEVEYDSEFPISCVSQFGPIAIASLPGLTEVKFPYNVCFIQGNYVLKSESVLKLEEQKFDTIFCLSVTKWIHLNWGDEGLKLTFLRMHAQLRNGGYLILEAQPYSSYRKKKNITETHLKNFTEMKLLPEQFNEFLLNVVGFKKCDLIDIPAHSSKGFSRPLYLFTKGTDFRYSQPKHIVFEKKDSIDSSSSSDMEELSD